jgi:hypothetical protein
MIQGDVWAITPSTSDVLLRAAAAVTGTAPITLALIKNDVANNGCGYKIVITTTGVDTGITFTVKGVKVGDLTGSITTEVLTGPSASTVSTANFYTYVSSITASGAAAANVSVGTVGSLALPRTRIKGLYYVTGATAGSIKVNTNSTSGTLVLQIDTPAVTAAAFASSVTIPIDGLLTTRSSATDFAIVTLAVVTAVTLFCG